VTFSAGLLEEVMCRFEFLQHVINSRKAAAAANTASAAAAGRVAALGSNAANAAANREVLAAEAEALQMATLLSGILGGNPGQLRIPFAEDLLAFFAASIQWLQKSERSATQFLQLQVRQWVRTAILCKVHGVSINPVCVPVEEDV
jgi:hypothetical protein